MMDYASMVQEIDEKGEGLTGWEVDFISSLIDGEREHFSDKQKEIIERIYRERV